MKLEAFETPQLVVAPSVWEDAPALTALAAQCARYFAFDPPADQSPAQVIEAGLGGLTLPPGGSPQNHTHLSVRRQGTLIGYFDVYRGYPHGGCAYISILFLTPDARGGGLGGELVEALKARLAALGHTEARVGVSLRNWPGLRFWAAMGFNAVTKVSAPGHWAADKTGVIELAARLGGASV